MACLHHPAHAEIHPAAMLGLLPWPSPLGMTDHSAHGTVEMLLELLLHPEGWALRAGSNPL